MTFTAYLIRPKLWRTEFRDIRRARQRGASMVEFVVVGPIITLLGLAILQYGMLFFAKNQINHAGFMAARAGSMGNAKLKTVQEAYLKALIPMYGGGVDSAELAKSYAKAKEDTDFDTPDRSNAVIEILNPTKESFDAYNDSALEAKYGARAIPNGGLSFKDPSTIDSAAGQNIQDANLLKLRITHGYLPKVPLMSSLYMVYLQWADTGADSTYTRLVEAGRIPVVTHVTLQMQSDPIEDVNASSPGRGNDGTPTDPGDPPGVNAPAPDCFMGCVTETTPADVGGGGSGSSATCTGDPARSGKISTDILFDFDSAVLKPEAKSALDALIAQAKETTFSSLTLIGYTDQIGPDAYNLDLSRKRAKAVRDYLLANGFPDKSITVLGKGEANPVKARSACPMSDSDPAAKDCLKDNRRVEYLFNP
ncbi:hypothetical protein EGT07_00380 [Herbaspirillum sp. HC18]|nr:hypothetical protein EGT07_00380 [Herbaspirillum sp. HC18]